jgi:hypothetical protein
MASNPLNSEHFITDGYYLASDLVELVRGKRREVFRQEFLSYESTKLSVLCLAHPTHPTAANFSAMR